jgi:hypothetical protein
MAAEADERETIGSEGVNIGSNHREELRRRERNLCHVDGNSC